jgi:hypothetical protein
LLIRTGRHLCVPEVLDRDRPEPASRHEIDQETVTPPP